MGGRKNEGRMEGRMNDEGKTDEGRNGNMERRRDEGRKEGRMDEGKKERWKKGSMDGGRKGKRRREGGQVEVEKALCQKPSCLTSGLHSFPSLFKFHCPTEDRRGLTSWRHYRF
jgi:hypothetical protein